MKSHRNEDSRAVLPACAVEYIAEVTRQMCRRRRVRAEVDAELTAHFEDALRDCTDPQQREAVARALIEQFGDAKLLAVLCRRAKKRCRPLWQKTIIRSGQVLGLVFLYSLFCSLPLFIGKPVVRVNYVDWLNSRWRPTQSQVENAKNYYDEAARLYVEPPEMLGDKRSNWGRSSTSHTSDGWFDDCNDAEMRLLEQWLTDNKPSFQMLRRGSQVRAYWPVYDVNTPNLGDPNFLTEAMEGLKGYRQVALALRDNAAFQAHQGHVEGALNDCMTLWSFGLHMQGKGLLNEQLVGSAIEAIGCQGVPSILDRCEVPAAVLNRIDERMKVLVDPGRPVISLDGEEVFWHDRIQRTFTDDGQGDGHALKNGIPFAAGDWLGNLFGILVFDYPDRRDTEAMVQRYFEQKQSDLQRVPYGGMVPRALETPTLRPAPNTLLGLVAPAHNRLGQLLWRMKTSELATLAIVAVFRYRAEHSEYPATLDQLVEAGYLDNLPNDPFGAGPLSYRRTDDGFLLYSWGDNLRDDGGKPGTGDNGKPRRMWADNGDWVFWPVSQDPK